MPMKDAAMPISPIHHWGHTKAAVNGICFLVLGHEGFIRILAAIANSQQIKRITRLCVTYGNDKRIIIHFHFSSKPVLGGLSIDPFCAGDNPPHIIAIEIKAACQQFMPYIQRINMHKNRASISITTARQNTIDQASACIA